MTPRGLESPGPIFKTLILSLVSFSQTVCRPLSIPTRCAGHSNKCLQKTGQGAACSEALECRWGLTCKGPQPPLSQRTTRWHYDSLLVQTALTQPSKQASLGKGAEALLLWDVAQKPGARALGSGLRFSFQSPALSPAPPGQRGHLSWLLSLCKQGWGPQWFECSQALALTPPCVNRLQRIVVAVQGKRACLRKAVGMRCRESGGGREVRPIHTELCGAERRFAHCLTEGREGLSPAAETKVGG